MRATNQILVEQLSEGDIFFYDGEKYTVIENNSISSSFNELIVLNDSVQANIRLKKTEPVTLNEMVVLTPLQNKLKESVPIKKTRNDRGTLIAVNLYDPESLTERKLSKDEIKKRDECAKSLLDNPKFQKKYGDGDSIRPPGKTIDDVAYGTCTNRVKGVKNKTGKKKVQKESYIVKGPDRINTIRNAIRRLPNEEF